MPRCFVHRTARIAIMLLLVGQLALGVTSSAVSAAGPTINVNMTDDTFDGGGCSAPASPCSVRDAMIFATANTGSTINIPAGTYRLTRDYTYCTQCRGLFLGSSTTVNATGATIDGNALDRVLSVSGNSTSITGLTVTNGHTIGFGGGISVGGNVTLTNVSVTFSRADIFGGGGIYVSSAGALTLKNSVVTSNTGPTGAGIYVGYSAVATIVDSVVSANTATEDGGGVYIEADGTQTITGTTISGNHATGNGGGLAAEAGKYQQSPKLHLTNSTISGNTSGGYGGGIFSGAQADVQLLDVTVANNNQTGIASLQRGTVELRGTLLANPSPYADCIGSGITSQDYNLSADASCSLSQTHDLANTVAAIGPLANNGGPTSTHALLAGSPAIDKIPATGAVCPATDQRGVARPQGPACDIGAYEAKAASLSANPAQVPFGQNATTITFATADGSQGTVCVSPNGGAEFPFAGGASGSPHAAFINSGAYLFTLHAGATCAGASLATTTVTKLNPKGTTGPGILATPATLSFATSTAQLVRSSTITFDTGDGSVGQVMLSVNGSTPQLFTASQFGTVIAPWIFSGKYVFTLVKNGVVVDTATVATTAQISSPNGTTAGGPSPNVATMVGKPVPLTFDTGSGQPAALCTQFGGLVSFSQNGAGNATSVDTTGPISYSLHTTDCGGPTVAGPLTVTAS